MNHLQFADNTLLFFDTMEDNVKIVIAILRCFNAVSGLRLASPRVCTQDFSGFSSLDYFADIMGCRVDSFPSTYLGLPLFLGSESKTIWNRLWKKLRKSSSWKAKCFSLGGGVTLIQSLLTNRPIHFISILKSPISVVSCIEEFQ